MPATSSPPRLRGQAPRQRAASVLPARERRALKPRARDSFDETVESHNKRSLFNLVVLIGCGGIGGGGGAAIY